MDVVDIDWCQCRTVSRAPGVDPDGARADTKQGRPGMNRLDRPPGRWGSPTRSVACGRNRAMAVVASLLLASPRSSDVPETEAPHRAEMSSIPPRTAYIVGRRWGWGCDVRGRDGRGWDLVSLGIANGRWSFINCSPSVVDTGLSQLGRSQGQRGWPSMAKLDTRGSAAGCHPPTLPLPPPVPGIPGCPDSAKFSASSKGIVALKMGPFTPFPWRSWCNCSTRKGSRRSLVEVKGKQVVRVVVVVEVEVEVASLDVSWMETGKLSPPASAVGWSLEFFKMATSMESW